MIQIWILCGQNIKAISLKEQFFSCWKMKLIHFHFAALRLTWIYAQLTVVRFCNRKNILLKHKWFQICCILLQVLNETFYIIFFQWNEHFIKVKGSNKLPVDPESTEWIPSLAFECFKELSITRKSPIKAIHSVYKLKVDNGIVQSLVS